MSVSLLLFLLPLLPRTSLQLLPVTFLFFPFSPPFFCINLASYSSLFPRSRDKVVRKVRLASSFLSPFLSPFLSFPSLPSVLFSPADFRTGEENRDLYNFFHAQICSTSVFWWNDPGFFSFLFLFFPSPTILRYLFLNSSF